MNKGNVESNKRITLDAKHHEILNNIKDEKNNIPNLKNELKQLYQEYSEIKSIPKKNLSIEQFNHKFNLKNKIIDLKQKIKSIKNNDSLNDYYLKVGDILYQYYDNIDNISTTKDNQNDSFVHTNDDSPKSKKTKNENKINVIDFFNNPETVSQKSVEDTQTKEVNYTNTKISDFVKTKSNFKRTHILNDYLKKIDSEYTSEIMIDNDVYKCPDCDNEEMILLASEGIQICKKCGLQQSVLIESDKPSFKDPPPEICYFSYKRINHLNELLQCFVVKIINYFSKIFSIV